MLFDAVAAAYYTAVVGTVVVDNVFAVVLA